MADFTFDDISARQLDTGVKAQSTSALKAQSFLQILKTIFAGSAYLELTRNGVLAPRIPLVGTPTIVGTSLQWPAQNSVISSGVALDIDSGTWSAKIVSASGGVAYPATVGKLTGVVRLSASIPAGSSTVSIASAKIDAPAFAIDPTPPPTPPGLVPLDLAVNDMKLLNDETLQGVNQGAQWAQRASLVMGGDPRGTNTPTWWNPGNQSYKSNAWWNALATWHVGFWGPNNTATNTRVQLRYGKCDTKSKATGSWSRFANGGNLDGEIYPSSLQGSATGPSGGRIESDGFLSVKFPDPNNGLFHGYGFGNTYMNGSDLDGASWTLQARLIVEDTSLPDDRANADYLLQVGIDYYPSVTTRVTPDMTPPGFNPGAAVSRSKKLTTEWQDFTVSTIAVTPGDPGGGAMSEAVFRANPPTFVAGSNSGGVTCVINILSPATIGNDQPLVYTVSMTQGTGTTFQSWLIDASSTPNAVGDGYIAGQVPNSPSAGNYSNDLTSVPPGNYRVWAKVNDAGACQDVFATKPITVTGATAPPPSGSYVTGNPPGSGWSTILSANQTPIDVPSRFYGWHIDPALTKRQPVKFSRSWDVGENGGYADFTWAKLERNRGQRDWAKLRRWVNATPGALHMFTMNAVPPWAAKRTAPRGLGGGLDNSAASPPSDYEDAASFIRDMYKPQSQGGGGFTAADIPYIEMGNEPKFGDRPGYAQMTQDDFLGGTVINPGPNEYETYRDTGFGSNIFFFGTARELAQWSFAIKQALPVGVTLVGCGWEQTTGSMPNPYTIRDFWALMNADAAPGVKGCDLFEIISFHTYMYGNDPQTVFNQTDVYRYYLGQLANNLGKSFLNTIPIADSECGHEAGGIASNYSVDSIATTHKRATGIAAAKGHQFVAWYIDRAGESVTTYPPSGGPNQTMIDAANACDIINGKRIRQAAWKPGSGEIWLRFETNNTFQA